MYNHFNKINNNLDIYDPYADKHEVHKKFKINLIKKVNKRYDIVILAVAHKEFLNFNYREILKPNYILYDVKSILPKKLISLRL